MENGQGGLANGGEKKSNSFKGEEEEPRGLR